MGKGGGGGLAFLNKKTWHPGGFKQQEEVWKREQAKLQEDKRLEELKKQIGEEREAQDLLRVAQEAGHVIKAERLEFMYKGHGPDAPVLAALAQQPPSAAQATVPAPPPAAPAPPAEDGAARALSVYVDDTPKARNEAWARLHGDPMLMIKQQEQASLKTIRANPVKMDSILREVEALKAARRAEKDAKRAKKEARRKGKRAGRGRSSSPESGSGQRGRDRGGARAQPHALQPRGTGRSRSRSPRRGSTARGHDSRRPSRHSPSPSRRCSRERRSRSRERRGGDRERRRSRSRSRECAPPSAHPPASRPAFAADGACAQRGAAYGLTYASAQAEAAARANAAAAPLRPAYLPPSAPQPEAPPSWQRGNNSARHTAGRLSEAERAQRLAAMSADAQDHEDGRWQRLRREAARDAADASMEQHAPAHHHSEKPAFLDQKERELFGSGTADADALADRVGARKHFQQRGQEEAGNAFKR